jgi:predicted regulator of Ras-like GTPase activity (Roadblock/LC7/MglB family)
MFDEVLERVKDAAGGVEAVLLVDRDGMIIARAGGAGSPSHEVFAASYVDIARRVTAAHEEAEFGSIRDLMVSGPSGAVAFQAITPDYGLIAVLAPDGILGRARFELRKAGASLLPELED